MSERDFSKTLIFCEITSLFFSATRIDIYAFVTLVVIVCSLCILSFLISPLYSFAALRPYINVPSNNCILAPIFAVRTLGCINENSKVSGAANSLSGMTFS